jgi:hypothetical protein
MDFKNSLTYRTDRFNTYRLCGDNRYKYENHGILEKCLPRILFKGNAILVTFLQLIDMRIIMMFKYCDRIKNFKNYMKYE